MVKRVLAFLLVFAMLLCLVACGNNSNQGNGQTVVVIDDRNGGDDDNKKAEDDKKNAEEEKRRAEEQAKKDEAQVVVDEFMTAFCELNLKNMVECTDADVDYTQMEFLSMDEYERTLLNEFAMFEAMGIPLDGFKELVTKLLNTYEKYAEYRIADVRIQGEACVFDIDIEFVKLATLYDVLDNAIARVDTEEVSSKLAASMLIGGITSGSLSGAMKAIVDPLISTMDVALTRSIEELKPETGYVTLYVTKQGSKWVISDNSSNISDISRVFELPDSAQ